jgi:CHAT domain-containing protein
MIRILLTVLLFVLEIHVLAQSKADELFQEGKDHLDKDERAKAIQAFSNSRLAYLKEQNYYRYFVATQALSIIYQDTNEGNAAEKLIIETIAVIPQKNDDQFVLHAKLQDNLGYTYLNVLNEPDKAIAAYTKSIDLYHRAGKVNTKDIAFEFVNRALTFQQLSQFQLSIDDLLKAIIIFEKDPDTSSRELANNYYTLGMNYTDLEDFEKAFAALQKGFLLISKETPTEQHAQFYNAIGKAYHAQAHYKPALENYTLAKNLNESIFGKDALNYALNIINMGNACKDMGDLETAMTYYQEVITLYQETPPDDLGNVIDLFLNVSRITDQLGLFDQSKAINEQALNFAVSSLGKNSLPEAAVYEHMAAGAYNHGEFDESLTYNFKVISLLEANNYPMNGFYSEIYNNIGQAYDALHDFNLALKYKQQASDLYSKVYGSSHSSVAMAMGNIGLTYELSGDYDKALDYLTKSLTLLLKAPEYVQKDVGITNMDIGRLYLKKKDIQRALEFLEKTRSIFEESGKSLNKAKVYNELGFAYATLQDYAKADECFQKAIIANVFNFESMNTDVIPENPDYISYQELVTSYISKADLHRKKGDKHSLQKAMNQLNAADQLLKKTASDMSNTKDRLELTQLNFFFTECGLQLMDKLFALTLDPLYLEKAFYYSERSKANELLADIRLSKATTLSRIPKKIFSHRNELSIRINTLHQQIASAYAAGNQSLITKLKTQEFDLLKEYEEVQAQIIRLSPMVSSIISQRIIPAWSEIKKSLDTKTAIVSYTITDSAKYILIGNTTSLILKKIDPSVNLDRLVRGIISQIKFQSPLAKQTAQQLTAILWTPVEEALRAMNMHPDKIVILAEGPLNCLPFESLGTDQYLAEKYIVYYQLSGALLANAQPRKIKTKPSFIALAPVFEDKETNYLNKSCQRFMEFSRKADTTSRAFSLNGEYITPLPGTRAEVEKINQIHTDRGMLTKFFIEEAAREELIKSGELDNFDYIHLATHGFVNNQYPELSGLLLTQNAKSAEDGVLYTGEILGLHFNAELVTLSACETALGKKIEGEGLRGLTTAFLFAGARNVVASLWKVSDESTSELMIHFYSELLTGKDKATALRAAKLSLIKSEKYNHPYYWAPFVQIGAN